MKTSVGRDIDETAVPMRKPSRHPGAWGLGVIVATLVTFVLWASLAPLSGAVVTVGQVKPQFSRKAVQHQEGGIIKQLLVKDGDRVVAGQPLIELEKVSTDANHQLLWEMTVFEAVKLARLDAEQQLLNRFELPADIRLRHGEDLVMPAYQRELKIFQIRRNGLDQQQSALEEQLRAIDRERQSLQNQVQANSEGMRLVEEELNMNRSLQSQQFVTRTRVMAFERAMGEYKSKLGEYESDLARAEQRLNEVRLRMAVLRNEHQRLASEEFKESSHRLTELRERLRPAEDALKRTAITAPVAGSVVGSRFHAPGQVAGPREVLLEIVPNDESLIIESRVTVDDINDLHIGQEADLRFTAFQARTTPVVTGTVTYVSADALVNASGAPFYQVHIRPDPASLKAAEIQAIQPGMAAEVFIRTQGRTVVHYLLSPITDTLRKSMREP